MTIFQYIREQRQDYETKEIQIGKNRRYSQYETIEKVESYWACTYMKDAKDELIGELPFITVAADKVLKEAEVTDFDRKDVTLAPKNATNKSRMKNMVATKAVHEYMDEKQFALYLNDFCLTRALYGGVVSKKTKNGVKVVPWQRLITDNTDIMGGVIIERSYYTPAQMKAMSGVWDNTDKAIALAEEMKDETKESGQEETQGHFIEVFELHGEIQESIAEEDGDETKFVQKMMVVAGVDAFEGEGDEKTEKGVILFSDTEKESPYKYNARNATYGRALGRGVIEDLFSQQKWYNFTISEELRLIAASKIIFETNNEKVPKTMRKLDHLSVVKHSTDEEYFRQVQTAPSSLPTTKDMRVELLANTRNVSGAHESVTGEEGKANKPFRLAAQQNIEGHARYKKQREIMGLHLEEVITDWVLQDALKNIMKADELYTHFEPNELVLIDNIVKQKILNKMVEDGEVITEETIEKIERDFGKQGSKRYLTKIKETLQDVDGSVKITLVDESVDKAAFGETRASFVQMLGVDHPWSKAMIRKSMDEFGITMEELQIEEEKVQATGSANNVSFDEQGAEQAPAQQVA